MDPNKIINKINNIVKGITAVKNIYIEEKDLTLDYATIFSHSDSEFLNITKMAQIIGKQISEHNGPIFKLNKPLIFDNGTLKFFRIRKPDSNRPQIGCGDFKVSDYQSFKNKYLGKKNFELFKVDNFEFLGIHDLTQNYLVYFPEKPFTDDFK